MSFYEDRGRIMKLKGFDVACIYKKEISDKWIKKKVINGL